MATARKRRNGGDAVTAIVREVVAAHPDAPARTLARRIVRETRGALTIDQARNRVLYAIGQKGNRERAAATSRDHFRPARKPGQLAELPPSRAEPWPAFDLGVVGAVGVLSDIHCPFHDETAVRAAVKFLKRERPAVLLLNGDFADFYTISRHETNPRFRNLPAELDAIRELMKWLRQEFPDSRIVAKCGNHEERWDSWIFRHAPEISDSPIMSLAHWLGFDDLGIELVKDQRIVLAGRLPILHGHEKGKGISSPVNQARGAFLRLHHSVLEGHGHRTSSHAEPDMWGSETVCWSTGCLCDLRPSYARLNKWNHGFGLVRVHEGGEFDVSNLRVVDGVVRLS